jgi:predicted acyltransferase
LVLLRSRQQQSHWLLLGGFTTMVMGIVWDWFFPFNKNLWSSSFVLYTAGLAAMTLGTMIWLIDIQGWKKWTYVPVVFGANAITAYVLHSMLGSLFTISLNDDGLTLKSSFMDGLEAVGLDRTFVSLLWALLYTAIVFIPVLILYKNKIFLKL